MYIVLLCCLLTERFEGLGILQFWSLWSRCYVKKNVNVNVICLPKKHQSALGTRLKASVRSRSNWNLKMLVFVEGGKSENPEKNPRGKDENQQQTQPTYDAESGNQTRATLVGGECSQYSVQSQCSPIKIPHEILWTLDATSVHCCNYSQFLLISTYFRFEHLFNINMILARVTGLQIETLGGNLAY